MAAVLVVGTLVDHIFKSISILYIDSMTIARAPRQRARVPRGRLLLLLLGGAALLAGLDAALLRLGAAAPVQSVPLASVHGVLMVYGFLGTVISLERAVALRSGGTRRDSWAYLAPALCAAGTVILLAQVAGLGIPGGRLLPGTAWTAGLAAFVGVYVAIWRRQAAAAVLVQALGAVSGLAGIALWTRGLDVAAIVPWWACLLVLTVLGERLELARLAFLARGTETRVVAESCAVLVALVATLLSPTLGYPALGLTLAVLVADIAVHDVARHTVRARGLTRLMAVSMLAGYAWVVVAALVWLLGGPALSGYRYDTVVHALTIGFVLSMVMAHAPVVVPAIVRRPLPYHPVMWVVLVLLHGGLLVRALGAAYEAEGAWRLGGTVSVVAVLALLGTVVARTSGAARPASRTTATATS